MKFDIVRAWKDETYRESLNEEQLEMLPANPVGELDESDLATVCGGGLGVGVSSSSSSQELKAEKRTHSFALICDISIFSLNAIQIPIIPIASPLSQCCEECH